MPVTAPHPLALDFGADFADLAAFLREHPEVAARLRSARHVNIPLVGTFAVERMTDLHNVARELGTAVDWRGGCFAAHIRFGAVTLEAHHSPASFLRVRDAAKGQAA
jgi:hypothetical protein